MHLFTQNVTLIALREIWQRYWSKKITVQHHDRYIRNTGRKMFTIDKKFKDLAKTAYSRTSFPNLSL